MVVGGGSDGREETAEGEDREERDVCLRELRPLHTLSLVRTNLSFFQVSCVSSSYLHSVPPKRRAFSFYRLLEEAFVARDPFNADPQPLILGSHCSACRRTVCVSSVSLRAQEVESAARFSSPAAFSTQSGSVSSVLRKISRNFLRKFSR